LLPLLRLLWLSLVLSLVPLPPSLLFPLLPPYSAVVAGTVRLLLLLLAPLPLLLSFPPPQLLLLLPMHVHAHAHPLAGLVAVHLPCAWLLSLEPHCKSIISFWYYCGVLTFVFGVKKTCKTEEKLAIFTLHGLEVVVKARKQRCDAWLAIFGCATCITITGTGTGTGFCWVSILVPVPMAKPAGIPVPMTFTMCHSLVF
jgi:hypothetical protein